VALILDAFQVDVDDGLTLLMLTLNIAKEEGECIETIHRMTDDHLGRFLGGIRPGSPTVHKMPSSDAIKRDEEDFV
jgi:hypothetical protein